MNTKFFIRTALSMLLMSAVITSCKEDDINNFEHTPTERLEIAKAEITKALLSSEHGWKMLYFPDNEQFGGFNHLMRFNANGMVQMISDFNTDAMTVETSEFAVQLTYAPSLVFTTRNKIHLLSDSNNSPGSPKGGGYKGNFDFVFHRIDTNGDLIFKTARTNIEVRFVKATAEDWSKLPEGFVSEKNALIGKDDAPFFTVMDIKSGNVNKSYQFTYDAVRRYADLSINDPLDTFTEGFGFGFKENSIIASPAVTVGNDSVTEFFYNESTGGYTGKAGALEVTIRFTDKLVDASAFALGNEILGGEKLVTTHIKLFSGLDGRGNTPFGKKTFADTKNMKGSPLSRVFLFFNYLENGEIIHRIDYVYADQSSIKRYVNIERGENNAIILTHKKWSTILVSETTKKLDSYFLDPQGLLMKRESYNVVYPFPIVTLKAVSSLANRKTAFALSNYDSTSQN